MRATWTRLALLLVAAATLLRPGGAARPAAADEARPAWAAALHTLRLERDPRKRLEGQWALLAQKPDAAALRAELARPPAYPADPRRGASSFEQPLPGGPPLTVFTFAPQAYTAERAWPLVVWLHGAVVRDEDGGGSSGVAVLRESAEAQGFLVVSPSATKDCPWWSPAGVAHVRAAVAEMARRYRVDADRVVAAGFSDGASGCFHLLFHAPDPFACFVAAMGNPIITRAVGGPACLPNAASRPLLAFNGTEDALYPAEQVRPLIEELTAGGARITWRSLEGAGHDLGAALERRDEVTAFVEAHPREALPATVDWSSVLPAVDGRRAWAEILEVDAAAPDAEGLSAQVQAVPQETRRPRLGISIDRAYEGQGLKIEAVQAGTPAAEAGFRDGDVIVAVGAEELPAGAEAFLALRGYLESHTDQDGTFVVLREGQRVTLTTRPRLLAQDEPPAALGYGRPAGRLVAVRAAPDSIEVRTRDVGAFRLHLARPFVDLEREIRVTVNGKEAFRGRIQPDPAYLLQEALRGLPGDPLFEATLTLRPR